MSDWAEGYVADIHYTAGYYQELNPLRIRLALLANGFMFPAIDTACELGFGQGLSTNIHAAASVTKWYGTDFNPSQAGLARELAEVSGNGASLHDQSFADFAARTDLPDFDMITLHGIWSWITAGNRSLIVDFIRRKLKVGGVVYISYNILPGWASFAPVRHLISLYAGVIGTKGIGTARRVDQAIEFATRLMETNPLFAMANAGVAQRTANIATLNRNYRSHEYFCHDWHPMHIATIAKQLESAKLQYGCSAHYPDLVDAVNLTPVQQKFLNDIPDPMFRESVRDFIVNQQFRRDYWIKGTRKLSTLESAEALRQQRVVLTSQRSGIPLKVIGSQGEVKLHPDVYNPLLDALSDHTPRSLSELHTAVSDKGITMPQIVQAALLLAGAGHLHAVQDDAVIARVKPATDRLNDRLLHLSRSGGEFLYLASPVTGGGIAANNVHQLFMLAIKQGKSSPEEWVHSAWEALSLSNQRLIVDGATLSSSEDNLTELRAQVATFATERLPVLRALMIV